MKRYKALNKLNNKVVECWGDYNISTRNIDYYDSLVSPKQLDMTFYEVLDSPMVTHFDFFGIETGPAWFPLLQPLFDYIDQFNTENKEPIVVQRIKSESKELVISLNFCPHILEGIIDDIKSQSKDICEYCGASNVIKPLNHEDTEIIYN